MFRLPNYHQTNFSRTPGMSHYAAKVSKNDLKHLKDFHQKWKDAGKLQEKKTEMASFQKKNENASLKKQEIVFNQQPVAQILYASVQETRDELTLASKTRWTEKSAGVEPVPLILAIAAGIGVNIIMRMYVSLASRLGDLVTGTKPRAHDLFGHAMLGGIVGIVEIGSFMTMTAIYDIFTLGGRGSSNPFSKILEIAEKHLGPGPGVGFIIGIGVPLAGAVIGAAVYEVKKLWHHVRDREAG